MENQSFYFNYGDYENLPYEKSVYYSGMNMEYPSMFSIYDDQTNERMINYPSPSIRVESGGSNFVPMTLYDIRNRDIPIGTFSGEEFLSKELTDPSSEFIFQQQQNNNTNEQLMGDVLGKRKRPTYHTNNKKRKLKKKHLSENFLFSPNQETLVMGFEDIVEKDPSGETIEFVVENTVGSVSINGVEYPNINIHHIKEIKFAFPKNVLIGDVQVESVYDVNPLDNFQCSESKAAEVCLKGTNVFPLRPAQSFLRLFHNHQKLRSIKEFSSVKTQKKIKKILSTEKMKKQLLKYANPADMTLDELMFYFTNQYDILYHIKKEKFKELKNIPVLGAIMHNIENEKIIIKITHLLLEKYKKKMDTKNDIVTKTCVMYRKEIISKILEILEQKLNDYSFNENEEEFISNILNQKCFVNWKENSFSAKVNSRKKTRCLKQINFNVNLEKEGKNYYMIVPIVFSQYNQKTEKTNYLDENGYYHDIGIVKGLAFEKERNMII